MSYCGPSHCGPISLQFEYLFGSRCIYLSFQFYYRVFKRLVNSEYHLNYSNVNFIHSEIHLKQIMLIISIKNPDNEHYMLKSTDLKCILLLIKKKL